MIGRLTETSIHAGQLGMAWEQLTWPQEDDGYASLRAEAERLFGELGVDAELPSTHEEYLELRPRITPVISRRLSEERGKILGDTIALPFYFLNGFALRAVLNAALHVGEQTELELVEDCLEDLGLDRELSRVLERDAGWIALLEDEGEGPSVRTSDVLRAGGSFTVRVLEDFARKEEGLEGLQQALVALRDEVRDFETPDRVRASGEPCGRPRPSSRRRPRCMIECARPGGRGATPPIAPRRTRNRRNGRLRARVVRSLDRHAGRSLACVARGGSEMSTTTAIIPAILATRPRRPLTAGDEPRIVLLQTELSSDRLRNAAKLLPWREGSR